MYYVKKDPDLAIWVMMLPILSSHETEEYFLMGKILGDDYYFPAYIYRYGMGGSEPSKGKSALKHMLIGNGFMFHVPTYLNVLLLWHYGGTYRLVGCCIQYATFCLHGINGGFHFGIMHMMREYSPGVATGLLLYIPYTCYLAYVLIHDYGVSFWIVYGFYLVGCALHMLFVMNPNGKDSPNAWGKLMKKAGYYRIPDYYPPHE